MQTKHSSFDRIVEINNEQSYPNTVVEGQKFQPIFFFLKERQNQPTHLRGRFIKEMSNIYSPAGATRHIMASASVAGPLLDGTAGPYDDEARLCESWGGFLQRSKRGVFVGLEGARHDRRLIMGLRIWRLGKSLQGRLPVAKFPGSRKTVERQHGKASSAMFLQIAMLFDICPAFLRRWSPPLSTTAVKTDRKTPIAGTWIHAAERFRCTAVLYVQHMGGSSQ